MNLTKTFRRLATASAVALALGGAAHAEEVTIGFTGPLSGGAALYGRTPWKACAWPPRRSTTPAASTWMARTTPSTSNPWTTSTRPARRR
ncbi:hypothetical protein HML84_00125 [Alcanivorax sp. IO_7]|nr:hypothetical protein HML84_00125 [Alcanivorax sp. IO_7]